jgi:opacity protein-like surface antigen
MPGEETEMKRILAVIVALAVVSAIPASAVEFKTSVGIALSSYSQPPSPVAIPEARFLLKDKITFGFGGGFIYRITPHISLDVNGSYQQKGTRVDNRFMETLAGRYSYALRMLSAPVCLRYGLLRGSTPYVLGGFEVSYVIGHDVVYFPADSDSGTIQKLRPQTRRIDFAALFGGGGELILKHWILFAEIRFSAGLVNLSKSIADYPVIKTRSLSLQVGFRTKRKLLPF